MQLISEKYKSFIINRFAEVFGVIFFGLALFLFGLLISYSPLDPSFNNMTDQVPINIFGMTGASIADISIQIFGSASYLFLFFLLTWAYRLIIFKSLPFFAINFFAAIVCLLLLDLSFLIFKADLFHGFISS
jgi:DNA segregation ATPase FtsK/SpoIIIE-like protein